MKGYVRRYTVDGEWRWTIFARHPNSSIRLRVEGGFDYSSIDSADRAAKRWAKKLGIEL